VNAFDRRELAETLYRFTSHVARHSGHSIFALIDELGLSPSQIRALNVLAYGGQPESVGGLATRLETSQPTASRIVGALSERGYVQATVSDADRRLRTVTLTDAGHDVVDRFAKARVHDLSVFTEGLSERGVRRLAASLEQLDLAAVDYIAIPARVA